MVDKDDNSSDHGPSDNDDSGSSDGGGSHDNDNTWFDENKEKYIIDYKETGGNLPDYITIENSSCFLEKTECKYMCFAE